MKDIKELALLKAAETDEAVGGYPGTAWLYEYSTRLIAGYLAKQEPVAYKYISTTYPDRLYQISELTPEYFSRENWNPVPLYAAPPEPAPSEFSAEQRDKDWSAIKSTAPSSEEVKRIVGDTFEASMSYQSGEIGPITLRQENAIRVVVWDSVNAVLAARVPDGCVVVPKSQITHYEKMLEAASRQLARWQEKYGKHQPDWLPPAGDVTLQELIDEAMIAAGAVKP